MEKNPNNCSLTLSDTVFLIIKFQIIIINRFSYPPTNSKFVLLLTIEKQKIKNGTVRCQITL